MGDFRVGAIAHHRRVHQRRHIADIRQIRVKPGREIVRRFAHQQRFGERAGEILIAARLVVRRVVGISLIKARRRVSNGALKRLIIKRAGVIQAEGERKRCVVMGADANRVCQLAEVIDKARADILGQRRQYFMPARGLRQIGFVQLLGERQQPAVTIRALKRGAERRGEIRHFARHIRKRDVFIEQRDDLFAARQRRIAAQAAQQQPVAVHRRMPVKAAVENRVQFARR